MFSLSSNRLKYAQILRDSIQRTRGITKVCTSRGASRKSAAEILCKQVLLSMLPAFWRLCRGAFKDCANWNSHKPSSNRTLPDTVRSADSTIPTTIKDGPMTDNPVAHRADHRSEPIIPHRPRPFHNGSFLGLKILHEPPVISEISLDIVFVHGLTGSSQNTWLDKDSHVYWPIDLLPDDIPTARILAFGYDADVTKILGPVSQNTLRDHAETLVIDLAAARAEPNTVSSSD